MEYQKPELEIVMIGTADIICTSGGEWDPDKDLDDLLNPTWV